MGRKLDELEAARKAGTISDVELKIQAAGGRLAQAAKAQEFASRVDVSGFIYKGDTYTLRPGEDYFSLAQRLYGNRQYFSILQRYNQGLIPKAGMSIRIPRIRTTGGSVLGVGETPPTLPTTSSATTGGETVTPAGVPYGQGGLQPAPEMATTPNTNQSIHLPPLPGPNPLNTPARGYQQIGTPQFTGGAGLPSQIRGVATGPGNARVAAGAGASVKLNPLPTSFSTLGGQSTFQNPSSNSVTLSPASAAGGGMSEPEFIKNHAINIQTTTEDTGKLPFVVSKEAADVLGITGKLKRAGYMFSGGTYRADPHAQFLLNQQRSLKTDISAGGSVPRPDIIYRRRSPAEISRGDVARGGWGSNYVRYATPNFGGSSYRNQSVGLINWRQDFV